MSPLTCTSIRVETWPPHCINTSRQLTRGFGSHGDMVRVLHVAITKQWQKNYHLPWKYGYILTKSHFDRLTAAMKRYFSKDFLKSHKIEKAMVTLSVKTLVGEWKTVTAWLCINQLSFISSFLQNPFRPWKMCLTVDGSVTKTVTTPWTGLQTRTVMSLACVINEQTWDDSYRKKFLWSHREKEDWVIFGNYAVAIQNPRKRRLSTFGWNSHLSHHGDELCET